MTHTIDVAPVRKRIHVAASPERAFEVFTTGMTRWWPRTHSINQSPIATVVMEPRAGGRWFERGEDGSEQDWGRVLSWEEPDRIVLAWQLNADWVYQADFETSVEVTFTAEGEETIVAFEHRDLERYGDRAEELRGGYESGMDGGWAALLAGFKTAAEAE